MINSVGGELKPSIFDPLPGYIAFDEFKGVKNIKGNMSFISIENTSSQILDILSDRRKVHLRDYFLAYPLKTRQRVKTVTMDMYTLYMDIVQELSLMQRLLLIVST